jgi:hypothetical protein
MPTKPRSAGWRGRRTTASRHEAGCRYRPTHRAVQDRPPRSAPQLFDDILIPAAVLGEVAKPGEMRPGSEIQNRSWIATLGVSIAERVALQKSGDIAAGEAEAILIAAEAPNSTVLLTDERRARRLAIERGLSYVTNGSPAGRCRSARPVATRRGPTGAAHSSARAIPGFSGGRGHPRPLEQSKR